MAPKAKIDCVKKDPALQVLASFGTENTKLNKALPSNALIVVVLRLIIHSSALSLDIQGDTAKMQHSKINLVH